MHKNRLMELEVLVEEFGTWWGSNRKTRQQEEIDIVGISKDSGIYCECKYRNEKVGIKIYEKLVERSMLIPRDNCYYYLFSKSGFTNELMDLAKENNHLTLVSLDELYKVFEDNLEEVMDEVIDSNSEA